MKNAHNDSSDLMFYEWKLYKILFKFYNKWLKTSPFVNVW